MRTHAIRFAKTGGPEVLNWEEVEVGEPGAGQVLLRQTAVGLNYIDTYHRSGLYKIELPSGLGRRGCRCRRKGRVRRERYQDRRPGRLCFRGPRRLFPAPPGAG